MIGGVGAEFVVASPDVLYERVAAYDDRRGSVAFETAHWAKACLQPTRLLAYCSVLWNASGISSSIAVSSAWARSGNRYPAHAERSNEEVTGRGIARVLPTMRSINATVPDSLCHLHYQPVREPFVILRPRQDSNLSPTD